MKIGIIDLCKQIEDPRMNRKKVHKMETIIYISIAAVICGAQSWNEIEEFGNAKIAFFKSRIPGLEFIPSHDTFNRFFSMIKPDYFELIFRKTSLSGGERRCSYRWQAHAWSKPM